MGVQFTSAEIPHLDPSLCPQHPHNTKQWAVLNWTSDSSGLYTIIHNILWEYRLSDKNLTPLLGLCEGAQHLIRSSGGNLVAIYGLRFSYVVLWNTQQNAIVETIPLIGVGADTVAFNEDESLLAISVFNIGEIIDEGLGIYIWDLKASEMVQILTDSEFPSNVYYSEWAFQADNESCSLFGVGIGLPDTGSSPTMMQCWNLSTGEFFNLPRFEIYYPSPPLVTQDYFIFFIYESRSRLGPRTEIYDRATLELIQTWDNGALGMAYNPVAEKIAFHFDTGIIDFYDEKTLTPIGEIALAQSISPNSFVRMRFSPDGAFLLIDYEGHFEIWDTITYSLVDIPQFLHED